MHCRGFKSVCALVTAVLLVSVVAADTSLYIPDTDPQPISAGVLGVGNDGRTTWLLQQGSATGTFTNRDNDVLSGWSATLIEGPSDAVVTLTAPAQGTDVPAATVALSCTISNSIAVCVGVGSQGTLVTTKTLTETVSPFLVQGGGPVSSVAATSTTSSSRQTQMSSGDQASAESSPACSGPTSTTSISTISGSNQTQASGGNQVSAESSPASSAAQPAEKNLALILQEG